MNDDLKQLLTALKLRRIQDIYDRELERIQDQEVSYSEFLARLLREEYQDRERRATEARLRRSRMPEQWTLDTFPWAEQPGIDRAQIRELAELEFIGRGENIVFIGEPGAGKTGLAISLLRTAVTRGYAGRFIRAQDLFDEMYASLADRSTRRLLNKLVRLPLLVVDELGYLNLKPEQSNIFFKLMEERYVERKATVITTNMHYDDWGLFLGNQPLTDALLSRIRHHCTTIDIAPGHTLRK